MYISFLFVFIYFGIEDVIVNECRYIFLTTANGVFKLKVIPQDNTQEYKVRVMIVRRREAESDEPYDLYLRLYVMEFQNSFCKY